MEPVAGVYGRAVTAEIVDNGINVKIIKKSLFLDITAFKSVSEILAVLAVSYFIGDGLIVGLYRGVIIPCTVGLLCVVPCYCTVRVNLIRLVIRNADKIAESVNEIRIFVEVKEIAVVILHHTKPVLDSVRHHRDSVVSDAVGRAHDIVRNCIELNRGVSDAVGAVVKSRNPMGVSERTDRV